MRSTDPGCTSVLDPVRSRAIVAVELESPAAVAGEVIGHGELEGFSSNADFGAQDEIESGGSSDRVHLSVQSEGVVADQVTSQSVDAVDQCRPECLDTGVLIVVDSDLVVVLGEGEGSCATVLIQMDAAEGRLKRA